MDIVVDTSVIIAVIVDEPLKKRLIELTTGANLIAPQSVHWEIGNALSAMLKRNRIGVEQAVQAVRIYRQIPIRWVDDELDEALRIAATRHIYAYDAYLIRCAAKYNAPLLSLDQNLVAIAQAEGVKTLEVQE